LYELLEKHGYIERGLEADMKLAAEIPKILEHSLTSRNILVLLCQVEKISLSWMKYTEEEEKHEETHIETKEKT
jgi:hypothetical protein